MIEKTTKQPFFRFQRRRGIFTKKNYQETCSSGSGKYYTSLGSARMLYGIINPRFGFSFGSDFFSFNFDLFWVIQHSASIDYYHVLGLYCKMIEV